ncbi:NUDIX domain [Carpediemonas membranifera]|uniref:NUDIX domain n=1 Tax=Carpediemonas membranifera TaxID=201153 RepID=A0A8J6DZM7_9EUKA|nr:NUDIX domain [Carpediemonas membranifera]|eukprot:KAG9390953.1 NUDIX domain [Carpediemonas membranifera]
MMTRTITPTVEMKKEYHRPTMDELRKLHPCRNFAPPDNIVLHMTAREILDGIRDLYAPVLKKDPLERSEAINELERRLTHEAALKAADPGSMTFGQAAMRFHISSCFVFAQDRANGGQVLLVEEDEEGLGLPGGKIGSKPEIRDETQWEGARRKFLNESRYVADLVPWAVGCAVHASRSRKIVLVYFVDATIKADLWDDEDKDESIIARRWVAPRELLDGISRTGDRAIWKVSRRPFKMVVPAIFHENKGVLSRDTRRRRSHGRRKCRDGDGPPQ